MSKWGFRRESTQSNAGANTVAGMKAGYQPFYNADQMASKRNVIVTNKGWVRRENRGARTIDEVLVAANPGVAGMGYNSNNYTGKADISQMYVKLNANGTISANVAANLYVVFNTPLTFSGSAANNLQITVSNTVGGNAAVAVFNSNVGSAGINAADFITNANNTLVFKMPALQGGTGSVAATYRVGGQAIALASGQPLYNPDRGTTHTANLVITGAVANNLTNVHGVRIGTFTVTPGG